MGNNHPDIKEGTFLCPLQVVLMGNNHEVMIDWITVLFV